jgi:hypothetical protein
MRTRNVVLVAAGLAAGFGLGLSGAWRDPDISTDDLDLLLAHFWDEVDGAPDSLHWHSQALREAAGRLQLASWMSSRPSAMKLAALAGQVRPEGT